MRAALKRGVVIDGRNLYDGEKLRSLGLTYDAIGKAAKGVQA
jgi:hypothetical protein